MDDSLMGGCKATRIMKYQDGYIIIWKYWPPNDKNNPDEISPLYCSYLDLKNKKISKYILKEKVSLPIEMSSGLIGDELCVAYNQLNKKEISEIKTRFLNLNDLFKQKPVSITEPEEIDEEKLYYKQ